MYVHTSKNRKVTVHLIGEQKIQTLQSQIHMLASARVVGASVSHLVRRGPVWSFKA